MKSSGNSLYSCSFSVSVEITIKIEDKNIHRCLMCVGVFRSNILNVVFQLLVCRNVVGFLIFLNFLNVYLFLRERGGEGQRRGRHRI